MAEKTKKEVRLCRLCSKELPFTGHKNRGICKTCFLSCQAMVKTGKTTWKELEDQGHILPNPRRQPYKSRALKPIDERLKNLQESRDRLVEKMNYQRCMMCNKVVFVMLRRGLCICHYERLKSLVLKGQGTWEQFIKEGKCQDTLKAYRERSEVPPVPRRIYPRKPRGKWQWCVQCKKKVTGNTARGLCDHHYKKSAYYIGTGRTTWEELEREGLAMPVSWGRGRKIGKDETLTGEALDQSVRDAVNSLRV